jgi:hypothetical protein
VGIAREDSAVARMSWKRLAAIVGAGVLVIAAFLTWHRYAGPAADVERELEKGRRFEEERNRREQGKWDERFRKIREMP